MGKNIFIMHGDNKTQTVFAAGDIIMRQGDAGDCAYIIESGEVEIYISHPDDTKQQLAIRGEGAIIGEMALVDHKPRTASVRALTDCRVIIISEAEFKRRLAISDPVIKMIAQVILTRYRDTLSRVNSFGNGNYTASEETERRATSSGKTVEHLKTANEFQNAIKNKELHLYYQPIIDMKTKQVKGFEALMRWIHPERGFMPPNLFIPIAEDSGLIVAASDWAMEESCKALARLKAVCPNHLSADAFMSVNFTAQDMLQDDFLDKLIRVTDKTTVKPEHVKLEMTERLLMNNPDKVRTMLEACRNKGFKIAIDDFGTGYSSLSYLHHYPIDTLKIDRSFVIAMTKDESALNLVKGIINLAKSLKMDLVAEGIEETAEEAILIENNCEMAQGYKYSKPLPEEKLVEWLENQ